MGSLEGESSLRLRLKLMFTVDGLNFWEKSVVSALVIVAVQQLSTEAE